MNRTDINVIAESAAVKVTQAVMIHATPHEMNALPTKKPRRLTRGVASAAASSRVGRGGTVCGLAGAGLGAALGGAAAAACAASSLAFFAEAWRAASARSFGS